MKLKIDNTKTIDLDDDIIAKNQEVSTELFSPLHNNSGEQNIEQPTEMGEAIKELNNDVVSGDTKMSGIDLRSRLHPIEISSILAVDTLVSLQFLPKTCLPFTRQKKRLAVSEFGQGRRDIIDITNGINATRERVNGGGVIGFAKGLFGGRKE